MLHAIEGRKTQRKEALNPSAFDTCWSTPRPTIFVRGVKESLLSLNTCERGRKTITVRLPPFALCGDSAYFASSFHRVVFVNRVQRLLNSSHNGWTV
ncbi:jg13855 [Pararge aegeria aegeria]|uniref:Jg13855 protein n=1 Tax=Pararge aegeria aegeria TaxID=348720 RepID=A0A8S4S9G2_9NEOP|nr:jg13855 [Pararge aegeria aegeria]